MMKTRDVDVAALVVGEGLPMKDYMVCWTQEGSYLLFQYTSG